MFYTRPKIEPLNLDLVRLDGGGSCPSQFYGTTVDGQSLYIRYRGGWLSAHRGRQGCDPGSEDEELADLRIGPDFHGDILLEQVCDLIGLTVRGIKPPFTEEDRVKATEQRPVLDWSGRTTYWQELLQVTKKGTERFVETLKAVFHDVRVLTWENADWKYTIRDSLENYQGDQAILGLYPDKVRLSSLLDADGCRIQDCKGLFSYMIRFQFDSNRRPDKEFFANYDQFNKRFYDA